MKNNVLREKSFEYSLRIVGYIRVNIFGPNDYILVKQLLRSSTSVGANIEEAVGAYSKNEFLMKLTIAYKEALESLYWLRLLSRLGILEKEKAEEFIILCDELCRIMGKIQITIKEKYINNYHKQV